MEVPGGQRRTRISLGSLEFFWSKFEITLLIQPFADQTKNRGQKRFFRSLRYSYFFLSNIYTELNQTKYLLAQRVKDHRGYQNHLICHPFFHIFLDIFIHGTALTQYHTYCPPSNHYVIALLYIIQPMVLILDGNSEIGAHIRIILF